ncbi:GNAT family N-acetyltransferase [Conexibacter stalactiti]|uniref:GNAT family N-acetyltransferase n=1 Tax=Conexibacter stalactiti TaxID=1940611 RepID=A0ABU4HVP6_9ACTN|nr:GNAT family N-acetyltransferase [Conexibacter stalactiti]MDW5597234.1 GNAT family N-acetyltransferase [Conexibacter stalactiti]MEC5037876.1 GNAT family N-acetyltransferase [Conexibacter stalactiti]
MLSELQQYLRRAAAQHRTVVRSGPFLVHLDEQSDQPYANYAIPDAGAEPSAAEVAALVELFAARGRRAAFEFLPACAPAVSGALLAAGLEVTYRIPLMICPARQLVAVAPPDGVTVVIADDATPDERLRELIAMQGAAFGLSPQPVPDEDVQRLRARAGEGVVAYAVSGGAIVGGGCALVIRDGMTELAGIAVAEAARRRGIAAAVTAALALEAVARGATLPFLTPGDDGAGRVYQRAGFAPAGEMLHMALPG